MYSNSSELSYASPNQKFSFNLFLVEAGIVLLLAFATVVINWKMIRDGLNGMTDLQWHITWVQHFSKQISEGIWYPRWLAGTNYGYGSPTFVFYPPLVYYMGSLLKFSGLNAENTIIALFSLALFLSGITCYIYSRNRWEVIASFVGALAYMTAPYIARDIYFRGGVSSMFGQAWIPLIWWLTDQAILRQKKWRVALALSWAILALTHLPSLLLCLIVWLPYTLFFLLHCSGKAVAATILSAGTGLGIASFYLLPAIIEKSFVSVENMRQVYGGFQANLFWNPLAFPKFITNVTQSMQYIFIHHSLTSIFLIIIALVCCRKNVAIIQETWHWLAFMLALAFLMTYWSVPIWHASRTLQMVQFPWRLLQLFSFGGAALCGLVVSGILKLHLRFRLLLLLIILGIILVNTKYSYQLSRSLPTLHNPGRATVANLKTITTALYEPYSDKLIDVPEYRPLLNNGKPSPAPVIGQPPVSVVSGKSEILLNQWGSYNRTFKVIAQAASTIRVRTYYYPAWHLYVNKNPHPIDVSEEGTMELKLEPGSYTVELRYLWTQSFTLGVILSMVSLVALTLFGIKSTRILAS